MLFKLISGLAVCQAMRPELRRASGSISLAHASELATSLSSADNLAAVKAASGIVDKLLDEYHVEHSSDQAAILAEMANATEHMSVEDQELLRSVIVLVETTIYGSMDQSSAADQASLNHAVDDTELCNTDIAFRQSSEGDLGALNDKTRVEQTELDRLQIVVDQKTAANASAWDALSLHMAHISDPPNCPGLPARTMPALDVYFESSDYSIWYSAQQSAYNSERDAFTGTDEALQEAIAAFNIHLATRNTQFCDYKGELVAACAAFDLCFSEKSAFYNNELTPRVTTDMNSRIEVFKSGEELVHQVKFLLGDVATQEAPETDPSRYVLTFPALPAKGSCDLTVLDDAIWVPEPECADEAGPGKP